MPAYLGLQNSKRKNEQPENSIFPNVFIHGAWERFSYGCFNHATWTLEILIEKPFNLPRPIQGISHVFINVLLKGTGAEKTKVKKS